MAVLNTSQLANIRTKCSTDAAGAITWTKPEINAAAQAVEDYFINTARAGMAAAIETAAPGKFTAAQKTSIVTGWLIEKFKVGA